MVWLIKFVLQNVLLLFFGLLAGFHSSLAFSQLPASEEIGAIELNVVAYEVSGFNPLSKSRTAAILKKYTGTFSDLRPIFDAAEALEQAIHDKGYQLISVVLPQQPVTNAVITLKTEGYLISSVNVKNNNHFSAQNVRRTAPDLLEGETPDIRSLQRALSVVNLHPAKRVSVNFLSEDKDDLGIGVTLTVTDKPPKQYFSWVNNTGNEETGEFRLGLGFQHSNMFDRDHIATFTYTTSPDQVEDVEQLGLNYRIPVYRAGGFIDLLAFNSDIETGRVAEVFNVSGRGETYRLGYTQLFPKTGSYTHQAIFALEDKLFDNEVTFDGTEVVPDVRSRPLLLGYRNSWKTGKLVFSNELFAAINLSGGSFNSDADYAASRAGASQDWKALRYHGSVNIPLKEWTVAGQIFAQQSDEPLITGEQFGIGGQRSVRGFEERELTGDSGVFTSLQLFAPPYKGVNLLGFLDYGTVSRKNPLEGEIADDAISSAGLGVRWVSRNFRWTLELDLAHVLQGSDPLGPGQTRDGDHRAHFNLLYKR